MAVFELDLIAPSASSSGLSARDQKAIEDVAYAKGYQAGVEAANAGFLSEQNQFLATICEAIADQRFTFEEASADVHRSVADLVACLADHLVPAVTRTHFDALVATRVEAAGRQASQGALVVRVSPAARSAIGALLHERGLQAELVEDTALGALEARLDWAGGRDTVNLEATAQEFTALAESYCEEVKKASDERYRNTG